MQIEPWQVPVLVMALLALPLSLQSLVRWVRSNSPGSSGNPAPADPEPADLEPPGPERTTRLERNARRERLRTTILAIVTVVLVVLFVAALGPAAADILTSAASAVAALVSAVMAVQSYLALVQIRRDIRGGPDLAPIEPSASEARIDDS